MAEKSKVSKLSDAEVAAIASEAVKFALSKLTEMPADRIAAAAEADAKRREQFKSRSWKLKDIKKVPAKYLEVTLKESLVDSDVKAGSVIPGIEIKN